MLQDILPIAHSLTWEKLFEQRDDARQPERNV
jgi:hypothetical protein